MNGLFADILKGCASWFLYVFIKADAPLNKSIMTKRNNQILWLKRLDAINTTYNYAQLKEIVRLGIVDRYGKEPADILTLLYNTGTGATINRVGKLINTGTAKPTENLNNSPLTSNLIDTETAKATENLKDLSLTTITPTGVTKNENFWDGIISVLDYVKRILAIIGIGKTSDIQPTSSEWEKPNATGTGDILASVGDYLPWVMGGAIVWFLMTSPNTDKNKNKKER